MNTPPPGFPLPELDVSELDNRLRQLTPEINFPTEIAHSNKWAAELAAYNLDAAFVYGARHTISDKDYWQVEALTLLEAYLRQSQKDRPEAERWRNICVGVEALLKQQDIDTDEHRQSIDNEGYWAVEADCLQLHTARLESELLHGPLELGNTKATSGTKNSSALALKLGKGSNQTCPETPASPAHYWGVFELFLDNNADKIQNYVDELAACSATVHIRESGTLRRPLS